MWDAVPKCGAVRLAGKKEKVHPNSDETSSSAAQLACTKVKMAMGSGEAASTQPTDKKAKVHPSSGQTSSSAAQPAAKVVEV